MSSTMPQTMRAVVLKKPFEVKVEQVPVPRIQADSDVIIKVQQAGLCGSDLHPYRGHEETAYDFTMGHEVLGEIVQVGKGIKKFKVGDRVLAPFCTSCGACENCSQGWTARCIHGQVPGCPALPGAQAEYFRCPLADSSLFSLPEDVPPELCLLMTDILPTGYSVAMNARMLLDIPPVPRIGEAIPRISEGSGASGLAKRGVCVVFGCGPVGLCAITSALTLFETVYATDLYAPRLEYAKKHGAIALPLEELKTALKEKTGGRGPDACLEVVGHPSALKTAVELVRPCGVVSSCGVHSRDVTLSGAMLYDKNVRFQFGRCSVKTVYPFALEVLRDNQDLFSGFIENKVSLDEAEEYYRLFEQNKIAKTVFIL